ACLQPIDDARDRDVHDRGVEQDHEEAHAQHKQRQPWAATRHLRLVLRLLRLIGLASLGAHLATCTSASVGSKCPAFHSKSPLSISSTTALIHLISALATARACSSSR